ncbi:MAG: enolase C-terminal domain-like protein [Verrucomicrobiota bacterium]
MIRIENLVIHCATKTFPEDHQEEPWPKLLHPLDLYEDQNPPPKGGKKSPPQVRQFFLEIQTDSDISGWYGPITEIQKTLILQQLRPLLMGKNPLSIETLQDQMLRLERHGRSGLFMTAISMVDIALWDLKGKFLNLPVYELLGGPTRDRVPAYASMLGYSNNPDIAGPLAIKIQQDGYPAQKWFFPFGPKDGPKGMSENIRFAEGLRDAVGPDYPLMFDAAMSWNETYSIDLLKKLEPIHPYWIEEPVPPERIQGFQAIRRNTSIRLATGEHVYGRWQTLELLKSGSIDILQNDPVWTGGITEQLKIASLASSFGIPLIAHGHALLPPLHLAFALSPETVPMVEYLVRVQNGKQYFEKNPLKPDQGHFSIPNTPALGLEFDEAKWDTFETLD